MSTGDLFISKDINVNVKKDDVKLSTKPYVFRGDTGMIFELTVSNWNYYFDRTPNADVDTFTKDCKAMIEIVRPDGKLMKLMDVPILENQIHFKINKNISDLVGVYNIYVKILKGKVVIATIPPFEYEVKDKPDFRDVLPSDRGFIRVEDESLLCYNTIDDYGIKHISELVKTEDVKDQDELILQQDGITRCISVGDFLKEPRKTAKDYTDTKYNESINHSELIKQELNQKIEAQGQSSTESIENLRKSLTTEIEQKYTEAKGYTDTQCGNTLESAKRYSDTKLEEAKAYSDGKDTEKLQEAKSYSDAKLVEANSYSDTKLGEAKRYTDEKKTESNSYADEKLQESKKYTDEKARETLTSANSYSDTKLQESKQYADSKDTETLSSAKAYSDEKIRDLVGVAPEELDTIYELANAYRENKDAIGGVVEKLNSKADKIHTHNVASSTENGFMSNTHFTKLEGIAENANNYTHPKTHQASIIVQDNTHRFTTDVEKEKWNKGYPFNWTQITDANGHKTNGYVKTKDTTTNLPPECNTGKDKWGILQFLKENENVGIQIFYPIDGKYKGRIFTRAISQNTWNEWKLISDFNGSYNSLTDKPEPYNLPIASETILGGIKVGEGLAITSDGTLSSNIKTVNWDIIQGKPETFKPEAHNHTVSEISDLNIIDNLTSTNAKEVLSANQGKVLNDKIVQLESTNHTHTNKTILDSITQNNLNDWNQSIKYIELVAGNLNDMRRSIYMKTSHLSQNLPSKCITNDDKKGIVQFIKEDENTGYQIFLPISGTYKGRIFTRTNINNTWSEWQLVSNFSGSYNDLTDKPSGYELPIASAEKLGGVKVGVGLEITPDGLLNVTGSSVAESIEWEKILNKPSTFPPATHNHAISDITDMFTVENSLESNSTTNALSVAQGKVLDTKIDNFLTKENIWNGLNKFKNASFIKDDAVITLEPNTANKATFISFKKDKTGRSAYIGHASAENDDLTIATDGANASINLIVKGNGKVKINNKEVSTFGLINDLNSDSATDALSALKGKELSQEITSVKGELSSKETVEGSQAKANKALEDAKAYIDSKLVFGNYKIEYNAERDTLDFVYEKKA